MKNFYQNPYYGGYPQTPSLEEQAVSSLTLLANNQVATQQQLTVLQGQLQQICEVQRQQHQQSEEQKYRREEAYSRMYSDHNCLYSCDGSGYPHLVLEAGLEWAAAYTPNPRYESGKIFVFMFRGVEQPLILQEKDFRNCDEFLSRVQNHLRKQVAILKGGIRKTAQLLQNYFSMAAINQSLPFYAGWTQKEDRSWMYFQMSNGKTHGHAPLCLDGRDMNAFVTLQAVPEYSATARLQATERLTELMRAFSCDDLARVIFLVMHLSFLYSILKHLGAAPTIGLYLFCASGYTRERIQRMLNWNGDGVISMDIPESEFVKLIMERKDQPMLLESNIRTRIADKNTECLLSAIRSGSLPRSRDGQRNPLQAFPVILGAITDNAAFDPNMITIEVGDEDMTADAIKIILSTSQYLKDYLQCFAVYVTEHMDEFNMQFQQAAMEIRCDENGIMNEAGIDLMSAIHALRELIAAYYGDLGAPEELEKALSRLTDPAVEDYLREHLQCNAQYADASETICAQFCMLFMEKLQGGGLSLRSTLNGSLIGTAPAHMSAMTVYVDEESYYIKGTDFNWMCKQILCTTPTVLKAMEDTHILEGARVNQSTYLTRKTICLEDGKTKKVMALYKISQGKVEEYSSF